MDARAKSATITFSSPLREKTRNHDEQDSSIVTAREANGAVARRQTK